MNDEDLFLRLLLLHGSDPEPKLHYSTDKYNAWVNQVTDTLEGQVVNTHDSFRAYFNWLARNGLAWKHDN